MVSIPIYPQCGEIKVLCRTYEKLHEYGSCDGSRRAPHELEVTKENSEKRDFYTRLRPFIKHLRGSSGTTLFERITRLNEILKREKRCGQTFAGILQQIKIEPPKLGEEASCIIELIISSSPENSNVISVSPILVGVEYRKKVNQSIGREIGVNVSGRSLQDRI